MSRFQHLGWLLNNMQREMDWIRRNPHIPSWWFSPCPGGGMIAIDRNKVLACNTQEEFKTLLKTEYAISRLK